MFIWDFIADTIFNQILDWIYAQIVSFLGEFFAMISGMGAELFSFSWVQAIVLLFSYLAWILYVVGIILAVFEFAISYQNGQGNIKNTFLNILKGFMATSLVTIVPIELFKFTITLQTSMSNGIAFLSGANDGIGSMALGSIDMVANMAYSGIFAIFLLIALGYSVIKIFFSNLKRGGILLTQIAIGSLYMISVPRGYTDGFIGWCKQVIALCLTTFLQSIFLIAGLMVFKDSVLLGIGLMLSANEIPRIAEQFGLDTSTRGNFMGAVYASSTMMNIIRTVTTRGTA